MLRRNSDIYTIDEQLVATLRVYLQTLFSVLSTIVVISGVTPVFTLCLIPILIFYVSEQSFFTVRQRPERECRVAWHMCTNLLSFCFTADIPGAQALGFGQP